MLNLCKKESGISFPYSASPHFLGCLSWENSAESHVEQSSTSRILSMKVGVLPQHFHNTKQLNFQFQDQDSSSTQSTGESYLEVVSMGESNPCVQDIVSPQSGLLSTFSICVWNFRSLCLAITQCFLGCFNRSICACELSILMFWNEREGGSQNI